MTWNRVGLPLGIGSVAGWAIGRQALGMPPASSKSGGADESWSPAQTVAFVAMSASASPAAPRAFVASVRTAAAGALSQASDRIRAGLLVAFPTETVYGLGARVTSRAAVLSVFACKGRPASDPHFVLYSKTGC